MSKKLRVFLLSVLVVLLAVSSSFAALTKYTLDYVYPANVTVAVDSDGNPLLKSDETYYAEYTAGGILRINVNGTYSFADDFGPKALKANFYTYKKGPKINQIVLDSDGQHDVTEAELVVPTPYPDDAPGEGTRGAWQITWPTKIKDARGIPAAVDADHRVKFTISKRSTNSAIMGDKKALKISTDVWGTNTAGHDLVINAPIRSNFDYNCGIDTVALTIGKGSTLTFDRNAEIFADGTKTNGMINTPSGYIAGTAPAGVAASKYQVDDGGELIIRNTYALRGSNLSVEVKSGGTLTFDLPSGTVHDLRGVKTSAGGLETTSGDFDNTGVTTTGSATLNPIDGTINVLSNMTLLGKIHTTNGTGVLTKDGPGSLTLADDDGFNNPTLDSYLEKLNVNGGTLVLASSPTWSPSQDNFANDTKDHKPIVTIAEGARLEAGNKSINQVGKCPVVFNVNGTALFKHHAIYKGGNEIYPYENFITLNNGLLINVRDTALNIASTGRVIVDNGAFTAGMIKGTGTIEVNNTTEPSRDRGVLILTQPLGITDTYQPVDSINNDYYARSYIDFAGTIKGNIGLYVLESTETPYSRRIFKDIKADSKIENLIVYGPAQLNVNADTNLDYVDNVYLRSHRPGAENYKDGVVNSPIAYSRLTIGQLNFIPGDNNSEINLSGLKVDGSSSYEDMGAINVLYYDNDAKNTTDNKIDSADLNDINDRAPRDYSARYLPTDIYAQDEDITYPYIHPIIPNTLPNLKYMQGANRKTGTIGPRINVYISNLQLYANRGANNDFINNYVNPSSGIYALRINGTGQPSRIYIDGTTMSGEGVPADFTNKVHQIEITSRSDVRFTGDGGDYSLPTNNSIMVKQDAKLEIDRGATIQGHLTFEPSSVTVWPEYGSHNVSDDWYRPDLTLYRANNPYPADEDFIADEGWYDGVNGQNNGFAFTNVGRANGPTINNTLEYRMRGYLTNYTTFSTQIGEDNRRDNDGGEYAVKVVGDLTLARDSFDGYSGMGQVLVRAKPDITAYEGYDFTTLAKRFKVIGEAEGGGDYTDDFATSYNKFFLFRIPADNADPTGVTVENRDEIAIITLGDGEFMEGGEEFGLGTKDFSYKVPFTITYRGQEVTVERTIDANNNIHYYLGLGENKYEVALRPVFYTYTEGMSSSNENVSDITALTTLNNILRLEDNNIYTSDDITVRAEFQTAEGEQFVRLIGTAYHDIDYANLRLAVYMLRVTGTGVEWMDGMIPGFRDLTLVRDGVTPPVTGTQWSSAKAEAASKTDFTVSEDATVAFRVAGVRRATYETNSVSSLPTLVEGHYVWDVKAETGTFFMLDQNGKEAQVTNLIVKLVKGTLNSRTMTSTDIDEGFTLTIDGNGALIQLPAALLGDTGGKSKADRGLSLVGTRTDSEGTIYSQPVMFTLHTAVAPTDVIPLTLQLSKTVTIGGNSVSGVYDIDPSVLSGDITLTAYGDNGLPSWLGFYGNGRTISYQTGDLTGVAPGVYNFNVLAESSNGNSKLYTFTITVADPTPTHIAGPATATAIIGGDPTTVTLTLTGDSLPETAPAWSFEGNGPEGLFAGTANGFTYTIRLTAAAGLAEAEYEYTITAGDYTHTLTVSVVNPEFAITADPDGFSDSPVADHTYTTVFTAEGTLGAALEWSFADNTKSEIYSFLSGDQLFVEGVAKVAQDADEVDIDQTFSVSAVAGARSAESVDTTFTVEADDTRYTALTPTTGAHDAVDATYAVDFPTGVTADPDSVFIPSWLRAVMGTGDNEDYVVGIAFNAVAGNLDNGAKATVRIEASDAESESVYYGWDVTYNAKPADLTLTLSRATIPVAAGATGSVTATAANNVGDVTFTLSKDAALDWVTINAGVITVAPTATVTAGTYTVTVVATDSRGAAGQKTANLTITVTAGGGSDTSSDLLLQVTGGNSVSLIVGTPGTVALTPRNVQGTVSYRASVTPTTGLTAAVSGNSVVLTPSAAGSYTVTVTATDTPHANGNGTATVTLNVTVTSGSTGSDLLVTPSATTLTVAQGATNNTITLSSRNVAGTVTYESDTSWVTVSNAGVVVVSPTSSVAAGTYTVKITATDTPHANGNGTATVTLTITVTTDGGSGTVTNLALRVSGDSTFSITRGATRTVRLVPSNVQGTVSYRASVTPTTGLTATVSGDNVVLAASTAGSYTVTVTATDTPHANGTGTATATLNVTVTAPSTVSGSSGGGCDAGFGALALVLAAPLFLRRRRS